MAQLELRRIALQGGGPVGVAEALDLRVLLLAGDVDARLTTASASRVRVEIASRSCWAINAMMPMVKLLASGMSQATKSTPAFCRVSRNKASRERRSSLAIRPSPRGSWRG